MKRGGEDLENDYLAIINLLACAGNGHRWVLSEGDVKGMTGGKVKRKVVTIEDVRAQYQKELDRRSVIEGGNYTFGGGGDEMDVL